MSVTLQYVIIVILQSLHVSQIELYIGQPIEYASERTALQHIVALLEKAGQPTILMANFHVGGTQVDLVVGLEGVGIVLEIKGSHRALMGGHNGNWTMLSPGGKPTTTGNYYQQTITASYRVRDYLTQMLSKQMPYPTAMLLLVPGLASGSAIVARDHKVSIVNLDELTGFTSQQQTGGCSLAEWKQFANTLKLQRVQQAEDAWNPERQPGFTLIRNYIASFEKLYEAEIRHFIPVECRVGDNVISSDDLPEQLADWKNILITGDAGCGKSMIAIKFGLDAAQKGELPILVEAKDFAGKLRTMLEEETGLLGVASLKDFFSSARFLEKRIVLIVDGINECREELRPRLLRALRVLCDRYLLRVVLISQPGIVDASLLNPIDISILPPSIAIKQQIASAYASVDSMPRLVTMLDVINTGLEARMVGEIASEAIGGLSRFELFDLYVRKKIGSDAQHGISFLATLAAACSTQMSNSITISEAGRLVEKHGFDPQLIEKLREKQLLRLKLNKVSFVHELFQQFFTAEAVIRGTGATGEAIAAAMKMPVYAKERLWILGGLRDMDTIALCVKTITQADLLQELYEGEAGPFIAEWLRQECTRIIEKIRNEISQLIFQIGTDQYERVIIDPSSKHEWSPYEATAIFMIATLSLKGKYLAEIMELAGAMDDRLEVWRKELFEAAKEKGFGIRSELFSKAYIGLYSDRPGITMLFHDVQSGFVHFRQNNEEVEFKDFISLQSLSYGQFYYLLLIVRMDKAARQLYPFIKNALGNWKGLPYHLKLQLVEAAPHSWSTDAEKKEMAAALNEGFSSNQNIMLNDSFFQALSMMDQLDDDIEAHKDQVNSELEAVILNTVTDRAAEAWSLYTRQFDHPFDVAYMHCIEQLQPDQKEIIYTEALKGANDGFFLIPLMLENARLMRERVCPLLKRFLEVPVKFSHYPHEEFQIVLLAYIILAKFKQPFVSRLETYTDAAQKSVAAMAEINYWINRPDLDSKQIMAYCKPLWAIIHSGGAAFSLSVCHEASFRFREYMYDRNFPVSELVIIWKVFPEEILACARRALEDETLRKTVYQFPDEQKELMNAISIVGSLGNITDVMLLTPYTNDSFAGESAVEAIRKLKEG